MAERSAKQLGLSKADLPNSIVEVIATLTKSGFEAYIVGGGVRDTLLGLNPKDFDAVTDAKPHEIKDLFGKRCRIIGRRFQLAHVYSGRDMIEVATFRAPPKDDIHTTNEGMITRDNVWGDIKQDFARRDFSINAMYYQPLKGIVHDFCNALADIENKTLRLLGHAPLRIEEDPVRLLRALRFKAKLGFDFDKVLSEQFHDDNWKLLDQVSPHRLYDESQKMFTGGYLVPLLPLLFEYGAIKHLIIYPPETATALVKQVAINTDKRIAQGKSINPAFFYAALLWDNYLYQLNKFKKRNMPFVEAQQQAASKVIERQRIKTAIPKFAEQFIRDIWLMQPKLANPRVRQIAQLADHPRFRAAFDFLLLREQCNDAANPLSESTNGMGEWWQIFQTLSDKQKQQAIDSFASDTRRGQSKRNRNRNRHNDIEQSASSHQSNQTNQPAYQNTTDTIDVPKQSQTESTTSPEFKTKLAHKQMSRPQRAHYAKERAQLQQLSLGKLAGDENKSQEQQPQPLFTINAQKLAKQVPTAPVDADIADTIEAPTKKDRGELTERTSKIDPASSTKPQHQAVAQTSAQRGSQTDKSQAQKAVELPPQIVVLPKADAIPAKRRRRRQQSDQVTQSATATLVTGQQTEQVALQTQQQKTTSSPKAESSVSHGTEATAVTPKQIEVPSVVSVQLSHERIPSVRRRRQPSSTQSIAERQQASEA
ncbi:polynucleotide adenylyltransferase PcnB [Psychrobacter sp. I-STPA6b]|uniref:polynucleotide adenylyltransferase PcnB n=1 Tax=Psychrobacter sp. I-STPA6b TaxID=2585718 RepID=UPI001D0C7C5B|nr:polynucleotide adenylyltransferase PcnB [Psychrobacter sp. I-STPA6b]